MSAIRRLAASVDLYFLGRESPVTEGKPWPPGEPTLVKALAAYARDDYQSGGYFAKVSDESDDKITLRVSKWHGSPFVDRVEVTGLKGTTAKVVAYLTTGEKGFKWDTEKRVFKLPHLTWDLSKAIKPGPAGYWNTDVFQDFLRHIDFNTRDTGLVWSKKQKRLVFPEVADKELG